MKEKRIGIFGLARTGVASYEFLRASNQMVCFDDDEKNRRSFSEKFGNQSLKDLGDKEWKSLDYIILSPGVPLYFPRPHEIVEIARANEIPIISDIEMLYMLRPEAKYIAITGTNGKSTTTALIGHILGDSYSVGGNIGFPALGLPEKEGYVLELSSYQLDLLSSFRPNVAVILNITPDHIDRHGSFDNYVQSKKTIYRNMGEEDHLVIGVDNDVTREIYQTIKESAPFNIVPFSIADDIAGIPENKFLLGAHNMENILAAYNVARILGYSKDHIMDKIKSFVGLKHRMQFVATIRNVDFYNDSKATNAESASKSIAALDNIYWLAGGVPKDGGIESLGKLFGKIKRAYLFGQAKDIFAKTLSENSVTFTICETMEEAVKLAFHDASNERSNILLAPACASFDQFKSFEHRGDEFVAIVKSLC